MSEGKISIKKAIPIIVLTWILSLVTTLAIVYFTPFVPIGTNQIGDSAVTSGKIANAAIITTKLADGSVTNAKILDGTIIGEDIADGSIIAIKVADGAITETKIADNSITTDKLADGSITVTKLADSAIVSVKLADNSVTSSKIMNDAIVTVKMADGAVTTAKILDGTITAADLADGSLTAVKIADGAITTAKLANYAVTSLKLAPNAIPFASTYSTIETTTTETVNWVDMTGMSVTLTVGRTSHLLIMLSTEAYNSDSLERTIVHAVVGASEAYPGEIWMTPPILETSLHTHLHGIAAYSYNFYEPSLSSGTYTIKIQWMVTGGTGHALYRTLTVIALPA